MITLNYFANSITILMVILVYIYLKNYRNAETQQLELVEFIPQAAWLRAGIFFCFFYLVSWATGTMEAIISQPIFTLSQTEDPVWIAWVIGLTLFILFAYWGIWARHTIRFERKLELIPQIIFGLIWGTAFGQMFLSFWHIAQMLLELIGPIWPTWGIWLLAYTFISVWQALLMDMYWDIYISPEHDSAQSIKMKVPMTHIPNVTFCLIFFAIYDNYVIFIALQTLALVGCTINMRMPSPWCKDKTLPARRETSIFWGLPRCSGYQSNDPANDKYLKSAHLTY